MPWDNIINSRGNCIFSSTAKARRLIRTILFAIGIVKDLKRNQLSSP